MTVKKGRFEMGNKLNILEDANTMNTGLNHESYFLKNVGHLILQSSPQA